MSRDTWRCTATARRLAAAMAAALLGCGRGDAGASNGVARAGADSASHAAGAPAGTVADAVPTPGFTSAQGTPSPQPAPAVATAEDAARIAPPPPAALSARTSAEEQAALRMLPAGAGHDLVVGKCLVCHAATMITQQHKDTTGWNKTVTQMIAWGAPVAKEQQAPLVAYLAEHFPARVAGEPARLQGAGGRRFRRPL
jgi:cytochrome c5